MGTKRTLVHEFAHRWDEASSWFGLFGGHSQDLVEATGGSHSWWCLPLEDYSEDSPDPENRDSMTRARMVGNLPAIPAYSSNDRWEDFAESVATTIYPETREFDAYLGSTGDCFVLRRFAEARGGQGPC